MSRLGIGVAYLQLSFRRLGIGVAYLQLSFRVCYRWLFARAWWVSMEKALPQKQVPPRAVLAGSVDATRIRRQDALPLASISS